MMIGQRKLLERIIRNITFEGERFINPAFIETNSSLIILVREKALKILKKEKNCCNVNSRHTLLKEEMKINSEITPDLYLGVVPIFLQKDQIIVGPTMVDNDDLKNVIEYTLCMRRLKQESLVYNMLLKGTYSNECSTVIARRIADFHLSKLSDKPNDDDQNLMREFCSIETLEEITKRDFETFERYKASFIPTTITELGYQKIKRYIFGFLKENRSLLIKRISLGHVVPIHGDFRSKNIFVENGYVYLIDRSLRRNMRVSDIIKDPAFLGVDLDAFGFEEEKGHFLNEYQAKIKDSYFEKLLPFYMCHLAVVSGIVSLSHGDQEHIRRYLNLACNYALR